MRKKRLFKIVFSIIALSIIVFIAKRIIQNNMIRTEEENWENYINSRIDSTQCDYKVSRVVISPNCFDKEDFYKSSYFKNTITIAVTLRWLEKCYTDVELELQKAAINIRNIVQDYIKTYSSQIFEIDGSKNIRLVTLDSYEPPYEKAHQCRGEIYATFGNQYDLFSSEYSPESYLNTLPKLNSLQLDSVFATNLSSLTEEELELFSDSKFMQFSAKNVHDFSFLEQFSKLKYLSITDFEDEQIDECAKHLPDGCELYVNGFPLEKFRDPFFIREYYETHGNR